ncbi:MAG: FG-GAP repeat domain-containing protein [Nitrospinales bacterium]
MIKPAGFVFRITALAILLTWGTASGQSLPSLDRIVDQIETMFPPVEGVVVSLQGKDVLLDLKQGDPIKPGDKLKLIRFGAEIYHPTTNKKMGREETELGWVEIIRVSRNFTLASLKDPEVKAKPGDGVRVPFNTVSFIIAPVSTKTKKKVDKSRLTLNLEKKLKAKRRFDVPAFDLSVWMLGNKVKPKTLTQPANLKKLRRKVRADFILFPSVREINKKTVLSYRLVSTDSGKIVKQADVMSEDVPTISKSAPLNREQAVQTDFKKRDAGPIKYIDKQDFLFEIVDFDIGDINGDGVKEYVIIDHHRVMIYRYQNNKFKRIGQMKSNKSGSHFLSVDVGDINNNGRDEIFVTDQVGDVLESFVLESYPKKKGFKKIWSDVKYYFRIVRPFGAKPRLIAQGHGYQNPFQDGIKDIVFKDDKYLIGPEMDLPRLPDKEMTLYGFNQTDLNRNKTKEIIILDNNYRLRVYSPNGRVLVHSDEYFGHDPRTVDVGYKDDAPGMGPKDNLDRFKGRLRLISNGNNKYLLLPRNHRMGGELLKRLVIIGNASIVLFSVNREGLERVFETKKQKGYLAAYQAVKDKNNDLMIHMAAVDETGIVAKQKISTIYTYSWKAEN